MIVHRLINKGESSRRLGKRKKDLNDDMMTFVRGRGREDDCTNRVFAIFNLFYE